MGRKPKTRSSFFKVLIKDHTGKLSLPHVFVQKHRKFLPENAKLRTSSGETWEVKIEKNDDDERYCFTEGWTKFVKDLELKTFEFLVFWFSIGDSTFDVSVYGVDASERQISAKVVDSDADEDFEFNDCCNIPDSSVKRRLSCVPYGKGAAIASETNKSGNFGKESNPRFEIVLTETRRSRWCVPKGFAEGAGLIGKRVVVLEFPPKQRYWPVILVQRPRSLDVTVGWNDFRKENGLVFGKIYSFELDPTKNVIQVKEKKRRTIG